MLAVRQAPFYITVIFLGMLNVLDFNWALDNVTQKWYKDLINSARLNLV